MYENADLQARNNDVWFACKVLTVDSVPVTSAVQESSDDHFGSCVLAADGGHHLGAHSSINRVHVSTVRVKRSIFGPARPRGSGNDARNLEAAQAEVPC